MNIKDNSVQPKFKTMKFKRISVGEAFEFEGDLCIKIAAVVWCNAISLHSGTGMCMADDDEVHQLHRCEITYEKCLQEEDK